ncbi:uncharacterized protein LOC121396278 [Xenopus laevis]|uniref:Uncharacterized protein LOC121396278 n=1 Tax=Xenopus laevis TaxID=8355 RepID=A0A8J1LBW5_XENLA|nr:uncharacterized protein LOC121396278 [Xenopus laevis]
MKLRTCLQKVSHDTPPPAEDASVEGPGHPGSPASPRLHYSPLLPLSDSAVGGGRLCRFADSWKNLTQDAWVHKVVSQGYHLEFASLPPRRFFMSRYPQGHQKAQALHDAISKLIRSEVIIPFPTEERFRGYYSNLFVVPKKDGSVRPILDLKELYTFIRPRRFKLESLRSVIAAPIFCPHQRFLRFAFQNRHFQLTDLLLGLNSAPRVFTKIMSVATALIRTRGISITPYLDDLLIKAP